MEAREIKDKKTWEEFISNVEEKTFLQSWNWGEFNKTLKSKVFRLGVFNDGELIAVAQSFEIVARRGTFLFLPHGPLVKQLKIDEETYKVVLEALLVELKVQANKSKASFIRIAPVWKRNIKNLSVFKDLGFKTAPTHVHPELTWELNVLPSEENLLAQMRKTTRYLVKRAKKNEDVKIVKSQNIEDIKEFSSLYQKTKERQHFVPFSLEYLTNEFSSFSSENQISVLLGKYKGEIVASGVFVYWQGVGFYHHGASSLKYPKIPVSYLLLWEAIRLAKEKGCNKFNFWGIAPISNGLDYPAFKKHPWAGLTLFKMGFGGESKEYVKTQDFILSKKYWISFIVEKLRKIKRRL